MGFLKRFFGLESARENRLREGSRVEDNSIPADFDVITVDPDESMPKVENRRPVIFENGMD